MASGVHIYLLFSGNTVMGMGLQDALASAGLPASAGEGAKRIWPDERRPDTTTAQPDEAPEPC